MERQELGTSLACWKLERSRGRISGRERHVDQSNIDVYTGRRCGARSPFCNLRAWLREAELRIMRKWLWFDQ